jgi:hypothetical protein
VRIRVVQSGGLAGLRRDRVIDTASLPEPVRTTLEQLVRSAAFFELPERSMSGLPDVIQYRVSIEQAGVAREITFDDETASAPLRDLVARALAESAG